MTKSMRRAGVRLFGGILIGLLSGCAPLRSGGPAQRIEVLELERVPEGHYLLNLQMQNQERLVNLEVAGNAAKCVASTDPNLVGLAGEFERIGNGVFMIVLRNDHRTASQWWLFRPDGTAIVKEVPDRGEKQRAVPVPNASLERQMRP